MSRIVPSGPFAGRRTRAPAGLPSSPSSATLRPPRARPPGAEARSPSPHRPMRAACQSRAQEQGCQDGGGKRGGRTFMVISSAPGRRERGRLPMYGQSPRFSGKWASGEAFPRPGPDRAPAGRGPKLRTSPNCSRRTAAGRRANPASCLENRLLEDAKAGQPREDQKLDIVGKPIDHHLLDDGKVFSRSATKPLGVARRSVSVG